VTGWDTVGIIVAALLFAALVIWSAV